MRVPRVESEVLTPLGVEAPPATKVSISRLSCVFSNGRAALEEVSFEIPRGAFFCVVGPSGCGKSTLLRIVAGLQTPSAGSLQVHRESDERPLTAMVFQEQHSVLPWMTVRRNIEYGLAMRGATPKVCRQASEIWLERTGLTEYAAYYPHQISGGMKQRVNVARAFAADPEILLMDEPFASLDQQNKALLQQDLLRLWEGSGRTVIYVTHDIEEAAALGDTVVVMSASPGTVKSQYQMEFPRPRNLATMRLNGDFNRLVFEIGTGIREEVLRTRK